MKIKLIKKVIIITALVSASILPSCGREKSALTSGKDTQTGIMEDTSEIEETDQTDDGAGSNMTDNDETLDNDEIKSTVNGTEEDKKRAEDHAQQNTEPDQDAATENHDREILKFVDVFGNEYETEINPNIEKHPYHLSKFVREGDKLSYNDESFYARLGVDVSHHQGNIDWQKVKAAGYDFAIIRLGYRGYGEAGNISIDREFENNVEGAKKAGLEVGVYFFAQAVNEAEAVEEAEFVLAHLKSHHITLPVVYDPESILDDEARTDYVTGEQFTENTVTFCNRVKEDGYEPMVYSNMLWEAYNLKLEDLSDYPIWYADYEPLPQTPYNFKYWQYTNEGRVDGIAGNVDIDIQMIEK